MVTRRNFAIALCVLALAAGWRPAAAAGQDTAAQATRFMEGLSDKAIQALATKDISREERIKRFRVILNDHFDVPTIGRWVLGRYWKQATPEEQQEYMRLFESLIVATYVDRFSEYSGETLKILASETPGPEEAMVRTEIVRPIGGQPVKVDWRMFARGGKFKIFDVVVEGVSMSQTQRSEFASVVTSNGGKVAGLLAVLREKTKGLDTVQN
jgi:phospholipid transport system substrate-binding protein